MTVFYWSQIASSQVGANQGIQFNPGSDQLVFDDASVSAASLDISLVIGQSVTFSNQGKTLTLSTDIRTLTTTNVTFADGSELLVGDNTIGTLADGAPHALNGTIHNDQLIQIGQGDTLNGGEGDDKYVITNNRFYLSDSAGSVTLPPTFIHSEVRSGGLVCPGGRV